jgi:predicted nucleic acid-binding protein
LSVTTIIYDMNIVVALLSQTDVLHTAAVQSAQRWEARSAQVAISTATWTKLRTGAIRQGSRAEQALAAFRAAAIDDVVPVDVDIAELAARLRAADLSIRTPDALILATGHHVGAAAVLTADKKLIRAAPELVELVVP